MRVGSGGDNSPMDSANRKGDHEPGTDEVPVREDTGGEDGVDRTLIRWMLSLTPAERLDVLQGHVDAVLALRGKD